MRCPNCQQPITVKPKPKPARTCYNCGNPIVRHDRYHFAEVNGVTVIVHRVCCNPGSYFTAAECAKLGVVGYRGMSRDEIDAATKRELELEDGFERWRSENGRTAAH